MPPPPSPKLLVRGQALRVLSLPTSLLLLASALLLLVLPLAQGDDTWAVLVCSSRFWFNYRHVTNVMAMYHIVRHLGLPDSRIILLLADDIPANARNALPGTIYRSTGHDQNLYDGHVQVDYRGDTVSVDNLLRLLTGRHAPGVPLAHRLPLGGPTSRVLLYMAGHGGDQFFKFHNVEEVSSDDLAEALEDMHVCGRHGSMLMMIDTCQGGTLADKINTPNVLALASSARKQNSYAHQNDPHLGVALVDRFTDSTLDFFTTLTHPRLTQSKALHRVLAFVEKTPFAQLLRSYRPAHLKSDPTLRSDLLSQPLDKLPLTAFFAWQPSTTILPNPPMTEEQRPPPQEEDKAPLSPPPVLIYQRTVVNDHVSSSSSSSSTSEGIDSKREEEHPLRLWPPLPMMEMATVALTLITVPLAVLALLLHPPPRALCDTKEKEL